MRGVHPVDAVLQGLGDGHRRVAPGEWGLTLGDVAGAALHVGLRETAGSSGPALLRVQALACPASWAPAEHWLLHRNRLGELVRFSHTRAGEVWVQAELPSAGLDAALVDHVLALVVAAAQDARQAARRRDTSR